MDVKLMWQNCQKNTRLPFEYTPGQRPRPHCCQPKHATGNAPCSRKSLWTVFSMPSVHAESPSATERMESAEKKLAAGASDHIVSEVEIQQFLQNETGADRLRRMFSKDHLGNPSPELGMIETVVTQSGGISFLLMAVLSGRHAKEDFVRVNQLTVFKTRFLAFRKLQDTIFMKSLTEGARWCLRVSFFSGVFLLVSQSIAVYRNKSSPLEYVAAGAASGAIVKTLLGPRAMFAGGVVGGVFGIFAGIIIYGVLNISNELQEQRHYWQIQNLLEQKKVMKGEAKPDYGKPFSFFSSN